VWAEQSDALPLPSLTVGLARFGLIGLHPAIAICAHRCLGFASLDARKFVAGFFVRLLRQFAGRCTAVGWHHLRLSFALEWSK